MPGFYISNLGTTVKLDCYKSAAMLQDAMQIEDFYVQRETINKFENDKLFIQNNQCAIITEGVLLNKKLLINSYNVTSLIDLMERLYSKNDQTFFFDFRGPFSGAFYDKQCKKWTIWTNQTGESAVFYYSYEGTIIVASSPEYILDTIRKNGLPITLNEEAIISLLTYGYMYDAFTPAQEIKRLLPGQYMNIQDGIVSIHQYYTIPWGKYDLSSWTEDAILEEINRRFVSAVRLEYEKDNEYGYKHLADMSGGLDCRMSAWVAKKCGYSDIVNVHYSQSGSNEEQITKEIVSALGTELLFYPLDNHKFLFEAEEMIHLNYGLQLFSGITGGKRVLDLLDFNRFGVEHTGMIGDVVLGSCLSSDVDYSKPQFLGLYSYRNKDLLSLNHLTQFNGNTEKQYVMIRGLLGALSSAFIRHHYTEITSPFMDIDFMEFCFSIPYKLRAEHKIYRKWIIKYYPDAAKIRWSTDDTKLTDGKIKKVLRRAYYHGPKKFARAFGINSGNNAGMNPFAYWYLSDPKIEQQWRGLVRKARGKCSSTLFNTIEKLFAEGNVQEKTQAVSAALAVDYWIK